MDQLASVDLCFSYGPRQVLRDVNAYIRRQRINVLVGPSGSGKSTLLWLLAGLLEPASGRLIFRSNDESGDEATDVPIDYRRLSMGMVFQQPGLWDQLTVVQHLKLVLAGKGLRRRRRREHIERTLDQLDLQSLRKRRPPQMSGGQRQRLAIARALVAEPDWLLLDEPLAHLDGESRATLFETLRSALSDTQCGVLMATHHADEALRIAHDLTILVDGQIIQQGPAATVYRQPSSLAAAQALGPARQIEGAAAGGRLVVNGATAIENINPNLNRHVTIILRPHDLSFRTDPEGTAVVRGCELTDGGYRLIVDVAGCELLVQHRRRLDADTTGMLRVNPVDRG